MSGGHTLLLLASSPTHFKVLATTADEAVGRVIDKVSRDLGLKWGNIGPGAALEKFCASGDQAVQSPLPEVPRFPSVMPGKLAFSFSGLHSFVDRYIQSNRIPLPSVPDGSERKGKDTLSDGHKLALARAFQSAAFAQLEEKLVLALQWCARHRGDDPPIRHIVVSGGVASNAFLRNRYS